MDQVITFDKSLQQRLQEYETVLGGYETLPVSAIQKEWGFYLELAVDPNGWQAIWKIQRKVCEDLNISFPSIVLVFVLSVNFQELTALVKVLAVQDDIHIPEKHYVPLIQLWPTKNQDKSIVLNLDSTANSIDMLRFFYFYVFRPWDNGEDDDIDWKRKHLEARLRLYYDMKTAVLPLVCVERLNSLISEAKRIEAQQEELETELTELNDDVESVDDNSIVDTLKELHLQMLEIKAEVEMWENPLLRGVLIKKHKETHSLIRDEIQTIWVIYSQGTASEIINFLSQVEVLYPSEILKHSPQLATILETSNSDIFILNESTHVINTTGVLEHGGIIKGISTPDKTTLTSNIDNIMLDFKGENVLLENLTIQAKSPQCAIVIRKGNVTLKNCKLVGDLNSSTHQGIIVLNEGSFEMINCEVSNFSTAIVGNSGSEIKIENCEIFDCNCGLLVYDNCSVKAIKATIRDCRNYGVCVETENNITGDHPRIGDFDTLNIIPKLQMEFVKGNNNQKGDAVINQKSKLHAVEDLFEDPDVDPTICIESDEDMETGEKTPVNGRDSPVTI